MVGPGDMEFIRRRLDDLKQHDSVTAFSGLYCEMIAERLVDGGLGSKALRRLFGLFVDWEVKYHSGLRNLTRGAGVSISNVGALGDRRHAGLQDLASRLEGMTKQLGCVILASEATIAPASSAALFTQAEWTSRLKRKTGRSGTIASRSSLRARPFGKSSMAQPPPTTHGSFGWLAANRATASR